MLTGASDPGSGSGRVVVIAVEPFLLASAVGRLLRSRGWQVRWAAPELGPSVVADAVVVSSALAGELPELGAPLTIVLSNPPGQPSWSAPGRGEEIESFEDLLHALGEAH